MPVDRDYARSVSHGLCDTFQKKWLIEAFDWIKNLVNEEEAMPKTDDALKEFAEKVVGDAFNEKFRLRLISQVMRSIQNAPVKKQSKPVKLDICPGKDYTLALNRGLFNEFQGRYVQDAFDEIADLVASEETLPETDVGLAKFSEKVVDAAFDKTFRRRLVKQVVQSIKDAPSKDYSQ